MPTPKQVRYHYGRCERLRGQLAAALTAAHDAGVIVYENYREESPCPTLWEAQERLEKTTEKQLANAMRTEIRRSRNRKPKGKKT